MNPDTITIPRESHKSFPTLSAAYSWVQGLINAGVEVQVSRLREHFFRSFRPRDIFFQVLGIVESTATECKRIEPNGEWRIEVESPGTDYERAGILSPQVVTTQLYRFSTWYSRFLPYAVAMTRAEDGFKHVGIDFESINSYYGTCRGFIYLGQGDGAEDGPPPYHRIDPGDVALYEECYCVSCNVSPPALPFDEALMPCIVYVACHQPWRIAAMVGKDHYWRQHIAECFEVMKKPQPDYRRKPHEQRKGT